MGLINARFLKGKPTEVEGSPPLHFRCQNRNDKQLSPPSIF
jgi:hypothetical protein